MNLNPEDRECPKCGSKHIILYRDWKLSTFDLAGCYNCNHEWKIE